MEGEGIVDAADPQPGGVSVQVAAVGVVGLAVLREFFAGLSGYVTNNRFQKAVFCGTLIVPETWLFGI
ncbi:MAG: hypothetical protein IJJ23_09375 [Clostridia bacterium]|nr:hypothetical protein [Clostridia bacterium]